MTIKSAITLLFLLFVLPVIGKEDLLDCRFQREFWTSQLDQADGVVYGTMKWSPKRVHIKVKKSWKVDLKKIEIKDYRGPIWKGGHSEREIVNNDELLILYKNTNTKPLDIAESCKVIYLKLDADYYKKRVLKTVDEKLGKATYSDE